jgi:hypothetical protein
MLSKLVTTGIVVFWALMCTWLVQQSYFSPTAVLEDVPLSTILQRAATVPLQSRNTLMLIRDQKEQLGHADIQVQRVTDPDTTHYDLQTGGMIKGESWGEPAAGITWRVEARLDAAEQWQSLSLVGRSSSTDTNVSIKWQRDDKQPMVEVTRAGDVVMDTQAIMAQAGMSMGGIGLGGMGAFGNQNASEAVTVKSQRGLIPIANELRDGFVVTVSAMGIYEAKAYFLETGELARVDLPQKWQLLDPLVIGFAEQTTP